MFPRPLIKIIPGHYDPDFEFSLDAEEGIQKVIFHASYRYSSTEATVEEPTNGKYLFELSTHALYSGVEVGLTVTVIYKGLRHRIGSFEYIYRGDEDEIFMIEMDVEGFPRRTQKRIRVSDQAAVPTVRPLAREDGL